MKRLCREWEALRKTKVFDDEVDRVGLVRRLEVTYNI